MQKEDGCISQPFHLEGGAHCLLLIHGFTGTPHNMRPLGEALHAAGYTVHALLLPGHGTRIENMISEGGWRPWLEAVQAEYDALVSQYEQVSVIGHSMGGALTLLLAETRSVHAIICLAAPMLLRNRLAPFARLVAKFVPVLPGKAPAEKTNSLLMQYRLGYTGTPVACVADLLRLIRMARGGLAKIQCPLLIAQPTADRVVMPKSARIIYHGAVNAYRELMWFEEGEHMFLLGSERNRLHAACIDFLHAAEVNNLTRKEEAV